MNELFKKLDKIGADTDNALVCFMGDEDTYLKYLRSFPEEPTMNKLIEAVEKKDYEAAKMAVHTLKGISANLRFTPLTDSAVDMLCELRDDNIEDALSAFEDVKKQYKIFCDVIEKHFN